MSVPPGLIFIFRLLPSAIFYPSAVYAIILIAQGYFQLLLPTWVKIILCALAQPTFIFSRSFYERRRRFADATSRGAVLPPSVQGGGIAILRRLISSFASGYVMECFQEWSEIYGHTFVFSAIGNDDKVFTTEPEHIKAILAGQFNNFVKGPEIFDAFYSLLGVGVFNADGEMWKFHRGMARPFFNKERISDFDNFERHANDAISQMKTRLAEGHAVDFQDAAGRFTLDSATEFLFGKDVGSLSAGIPHPDSSSVAELASYTNHPSNAFVQAFFEGQEWTVKRLQVGPIWPLFEFWKDTVNAPRAVINDYVDSMIAEAIAAKKSKGGSNLAGEKAEDESLLAQLVEHTQDYKVIQDELINILVAGRDTTSTTLSFAVYMLSEHPEAVTRLRQEILQSIGTSRPPTYDDIRDMKYLRAFINEVLRLYPIVPGNSRASVEATTFQSKSGKAPIYIPGNTTVLYSVFLMHRRTDLWGPDAAVFDPDRFLDERLHKYLTPNPFIFLPFNGGPRICLGQQFAYNEMSFFLVRLLQSFSEFSLAVDAQPEDSKPPASWKTAPGTKGTDKIKIVLSLTMSVKGGLWVRMKDAGPVEVA